MIFFREAIGLSCHFRPGATLSRKQGITLSVVRRDRAQNRDDWSKGHAAEQSSLPTKARALLAERNFTAPDRISVKSVHPSAATSAGCTVPSGDMNPFIQ
jgi:hypothetical protein